MRSMKVWDVENRKPIIFGKPKENGLLTINSVTFEVYSKRREECFKEHMFSSKVQQREAGFNVSYDRGVDYLKKAKESLLFVT